MLILNRLRLIAGSLRDGWALGDWKVRGLMGGGVVGVVFAVITVAVMMFTGGGEAGAALDGVSISEDGVMVFEDEPVAAVPSAEPLEGADGSSVAVLDPVRSSDDGRIADAVAATLEALQPTVVPTRAADYLGTLEAGLHRSRSEYPSVSVNPLALGNERVGGLSESEMELFMQYGVYFWDVLQAWVVVRSVLQSREVHDWERDWLVEQMDLVGWLMPTAGTLMDLSRQDDEEIGEVVRAYLGNVREAEYSFRDAMGSLNSALNVFERANADRFRELEPEEADEVWQLYFDAEKSALELGLVMSAYGCSICGELYRVSGAPTSGGR